MPETGPAPSQRACCTVNILKKLGTVLRCGRSRTSDRPPHDPFRGGLFGSGLFRSCCGRFQLRRGLRYRDGFDRPPVRGDGIGRFWPARDRDLRLLGERRHRHRCPLRRRWAAPRSTQSLPAVLPGIGRSYRRCGGDDRGLQFRRKLNDRRILDRHPDIRLGCGRRRFTQYSRGHGGGRRWRRGFGGATLGAAACGGVACGGVNCGRAACGRAACGDAALDVSTGGTARSVAVVRTGDVTVSDGFSLSGTRWSHREPGCAGPSP